MDLQKLKEQFGDKLSALEAAGALVGARALVLAAFDEVVQGGEIQRDLLLEKVAGAHDVSFVLFGSFRKNNRFSSMAGDGHSVAAAISGSEAPFKPLERHGRPWEARGAIQSSIRYENIWTQAKKNGIDSDSHDNQAAVVRSVTTDGHPMLSLVINDRSKDSRPNSHTDFHVIASQNVVDALSAASQDYPDTMPKLFEMMFSGEDVMPDFSAIQVRSQFELT